ncbi:MAG: 16S rRNA (guanine(527)-N(7))-methyltransferase RsmG [Hyphomicrobiaceae bacterium]
MRREGKPSPTFAAAARIAGPADFADAFGASPAALDRLKTYAETLALWQKTINLVSPATLPDVWHRHFADSAQLLALAPESIESWIDLGSGAGLPGLVVAILLGDRPSPRPRLTLIESDQRKAAFMGEVVRKTDLTAVLSVDILCTRIETAATRGMIESADIVSARALAPLDRLVELALPLLKPQGVCLFPKGRGVQVELESAKRSFVFSYELVPSRTDAEAGIIVMRAPTVRSEG